MLRAFGFRRLIAMAGLICLAWLPIAGHAAQADVESRARQLWQLLDYLAVDYGGAVQAGAVVSASEFAEMQEFAAAAQAQLAELPRVGITPVLEKQAATLRNAVGDKAGADAVSAKARALARDVLQAYPFPMAPAGVPDLQRGAALFQTHCAACHGTQGGGDGPLAADLNPRPTALSQHERASQRSLFALQQIISNGVAGTAMRPFNALSDADRWALAFYVGTLPYTAADRATGEKHWHDDAKARQAIGSLQSLTQTSEQALAQQLGDAPARALSAYLRTNPAVLDTGVAGRTSTAKTKLAQSVEAVRANDRRAAKTLALSAYLDGFEPIEPMLAARDRGLFEKIETGMMAYRAVVADGSLDQVQASEQALRQLLDRADEALAPSGADATAAFVGALTVLLREGLEALLVVVAMIAFLRKAQRQDVLVYVHAGWISALAAGAATWFAATYFVSISGASRELTEGLSSLFAAVVLLGVGMWMHNKSVAGRWQIYLHQKMSAALDKRTAWFLFTLAFIAVYREVFETVLFYAAMWADGNGWPLLAGMASGAVLLALLAAVLLRTSARLPIGQFFAASSLLIAVLAVVLAGKGIAGLQEAGWVASSPVAIPRIDLLGILPTWQTLLAQLGALLFVVIAYLNNTRSGAPTPSQHA